MKIAGCTIGSRVLVIAEAGANFHISSNPEANLKQAYRLIDIASEAGADMVKFQVYRAEKLYVRDAGCAEYLGKKQDIYSIIKKMEMPYEWLEILSSYSRKKGIVFFASPFDRDSLNALESAGVPAYKVASYSITDFSLLRHIAEMKKPIILSTGASTTDEIRNAISFISKWNKQIILMQCTAKYPAPMNSLNLRAIPSMIQDFGLPVGLSDHSRDPLIAPLGAVALGACAIEKHYTTDNNLKGPDHSFAVLPDELKEMVSGIRQLEQALGDGLKRVLDSETELRKFARHYIYAISDIKKGEAFTGGNIASLRPGTRDHGLSAEHFDKIIGRKALVNIRSGQPINGEDYDKS